MSTLSSVTRGRALADAVRVEFAPCGCPLVAVEIGVLPREHTLCREGIVRSS